MTEVGKIGNYFLRFEDNEEHVSSGCTILDCLMGGGYVLGRIFNIYGPPSTSKTGMCVEAIVNFQRKFPTSKKMWFHEAEAAFDQDYASLMGMPVEDTIFVGESSDDGIDPSTVEGFYHHLSNAIQECEEEPGIYVLDSLDALTDDAEKDRDISDNTYAMTKPKQMSSLFRKISGSMKKTKLLLIIISQTRDKINTTPFGKKYTKSGGKAVDFYASEVIYLTDTGKIPETKTFGGKKVKRPIGINVKAKCEKSKLTLPYREVVFPVIFGYGINDVLASLDFLKSVDAHKRLSFSASNQNIAAKKIIAENDTEKMEEIRKLTKTVWNEVEAEFIPVRSKY